MGAIKVCIVGRVNVGKSTLFNRLSHSREAIVEDTPGVTRDRRERKLTFGEKEIILVDTGGIDSEIIDSLPALEAQKQSLVALNEADILIFVVDVRMGVMVGDDEIGKLVRASEKPVIFVANKTDTEKQQMDLYEFTKLGVGEPIPVSAEHNIGISDLLYKLSDLLKVPFKDTLIIAPEIQSEPKIAVVGRPNVGKSSLINALLGDERHIVTEIPGTTRDSIDSVVQFHQRQYRFIDTAGLRRIGRIENKLDRLSSMMARRSIERCDIALLIFDISAGVTAQDTKIAGYILEAGKGCLVAANKWDLTDRTLKSYTELKDEYDRKFPFLSWAPFLAISAKEKHRISKIFDLIDRIMTFAKSPIPTTQLNKFLHDALLRHPPPRRDSRHPLKMYYSTQISQMPPTFLIFTNSRQEIHFSYRRFLANQIREAFQFEGWPIRLVFRHKHEHRGKRWD